MAKAKSEVSRFYLKLDGVHSAKKFINVVAIRNKVNELFEFKVTFEGIKSNVEWNMLRNAILDSTYGLIRGQSSKKYFGELSVGYHSDGNVMYKIGSNFYPVKYSKISKIKKPKLFLRISGFCVSDLLSSPSVEKENQNYIDITGFSSHSPIVCDLFISNPKYALIVGDKKVFHNSQVFCYEESQNQILLHLHFYRTIQKGFSVMIPRTGFFSEIQRRLLYTWFVLIRRKRYETN